jgi:hypothetical protein
VVVVAVVVVPEKWCMEKRRTGWWRGGKLVLNSVKD